MHQTVYFISLFPQRQPLISLRSACCSLTRIRCLRLKKWSDTYWMPQKEFHEPSVCMMLDEEEITGERLKCLLPYIRGSVWEAKWCCQISDDPARLEQRLLSGQPPTHPYMLFTWTKAHCAHIRSIMRLDTHTDADAHLDDYSRPPGASLKLFSRDLAKRERGSEMSIRGGKN